MICLSQAFLNLIIILLFKHVDVIHITERCNLVQKMPFHYWKLNKNTLQLHLKV